VMGQQIADHQQIQQCSYLMADGFRHNFSKDYPQDLTTDWPACIVVLLIAALPYHAELQTF
jgi:hypothetical protein